MRDHSPNNGDVKENLLKNNIHRKVAPVPFSETTGQAGKQRTQSIFFDLFSFDPAEKIRDFEHKGKQITTSLTAHKIGKSTKTSKNVVC